jgi:hypothetical protein
LDKRYHLAWHQALPNANVILEIGLISQSINDAGPYKIILLNKVLLLAWLEGGSKPDSLRLNLSKIPAQLDHILLIIASGNGQMTLVSHNQGELLSHCKALHVVKERVCILS